MLLPREEVRFDFKGARFDLDREEDRKLLAWILNQFLYGEVTGIQCGHWLYRAPHLNAAIFIAKQAGEELSHVRKILRILSILGERPGPAHPAIRFLSTGMMGGTWGEHVTLEMALGEGLVLTAFYGLADTVPHPEIHRILESAVAEEERHVAFGERETQAWLRAHPEDRGLLLGLALVQVWALQRLRRFVLKRLLRGDYASHPVLRNFEDFYDHSLRTFETRIERLGLARGAVRSMSLVEKALLIGLLPYRILRSKLRRKAPLLTSTYLHDPVLLSEQERLVQPVDAQSEG